MENFHRQLQFGEPLPPLLIAPSTLRMAVVIGLRTRRGRRSKEPEFGSHLCGCEVRFTSHLVIAEKNAWSDRQHGATCGRIVEREGAGMVVREGEEGQDAYFAI